jgi:hypothetical protein
MIKIDQKMVDQQGSAYGRKGGCTTMQTPLGWVHIQGLAVDWRFSGGLPVNEAAEREKQPRE